MSKNLSVFGAAVSSNNLPYFRFFLVTEAEMENERKTTTSYKEVKIRNTIYRVTSVFTGEKDLGKTLEQLTIRRAMAELTSCPTQN